MTRPRAPLRRVLRLAAIGAGLVLGAAAGAIAVVAGVDLMTDGPACAPDEAVGCGVSVMFAAAAFGIPLGAVSGGLLAHRLTGLGAPGTPSRRC